MITTDMVFHLPFDPEALKSLPGAKTHVRHLSDMATYYANQEAVQRLLATNPLIYEFVECEYQGTERGLSFGTTRILPGTIGHEYYMTKGHYHLNGGDEIYIVLRGHGVMLTQTRDGRVQTDELAPGQFYYAPGHLGLRTINTGNEDLLFFGIWVPYIEHDYDTIARTGFSKRLMRDSTM